jgi:uncharacterized protein YoxC
VHQQAHGLTPRAGGLLRDRHADAEAVLHETVKMLFEAVRMLHETVKMLFEAVRMLHETVKMLFEAVRMLHETVNLLHENVNLLHETVKVLHETVNLLHENVRMLHQGATWEGSLRCRAPRTSGACAWSSPRRWRAAERLDPRPALA